ncbi:MAG TPA: DUF3466 family protein, partial [Geoalkalibacter subterraneus]|nr:DUF3466 family protein [Geoalkalibacter subterraneus]
GDLVNSDENTWWFTRAYDVNDDGVIVGQTNAGAVVRAAFVWDPQSATMTYLGMHGSTYDDFYQSDLENPSDNFFIYSEAVYINNQAVILGNSTTGSGWPDEGEKRAFLYDASLPAPFVDLPPPSYVDDNGERVVESFSEAVRINNQGEVIITADGEHGRQAYYWDGTSYRNVDFIKSDDSVTAVEEPAYRRLGRIIGQEGEAVAINENSQVVINSGGTAVFEDLNDQAIEVLNFFPGESETVAADLNDHGHVVGVSGDEGFFWRGGSMYPMGHLGGGSSEAVDINNNDWVAGSSTTSDGATHAVVWYLEEGRGKLMDLGTLGGDNSYATAINDAGQVVGYSETGETYTEGGQTVNVVHGFLWQKEDGEDGEDGVMYDLGAHNDFYTYPFDESYPMSEAVGISENGDVVGNSSSINNHYRGFYINFAP